MAKGKGKKGKRRGDSSDEDESPPPKEETPAPAEGGKGLSRKEKRAQKQNKKQASTKDDSDDDALAGLLNVKETYGSDDEDAPAPAAKKLTKKQLKKQQQAMAAAFDSSEEEEEEIPQPVKKGGRNKKKGKNVNAFALSDSEESEEEEEEIPQPVKKGGKNKSKGNNNAFALPSDSEEEEDVAEEVEQLKIADEESDDGKKKKKKDKKKDKKSKLEKKLEEAKKKADEEKEEEGSDDEDMDSEAREKAAKKAEKAARKAEKEAKKARKAEKEAKKLAKQKEEEGGDEGDKDADDAGDDEVFYGAPDDHAWTDASHAIKEASNNKDEGPDMSLVYGPDGKKLSNKERKKLIKAREAAARAAEYEKQAAKASTEGAQFACSQTAVNENDPQWQNSLDINIPSFNISAAGKILFKDAQFNIAHGRRYGLVGPNGKGKSTLLKMIASRDLILPPRVDFLYVEQEVVADNTPAVDAVLKADKKRWDLLEEEKTLSEAIDNGDEDPKKFNRLQEVLDELNTIGAAGAEAKARRILFGLGFDGEMQTKPTKMFSGGWRMRISLARALFIEPTLLMLDEPTNHLDLDAVIWLDNYLLTWKKTLLIVSHDQDFLNSVCDEILHIEDLKLASYKGNYDSFKKAEAAKIKQQLKDYEKQEKRLRELKRQGQSKAKATETVKKNKREPGARAAKKQAAAIATGTATAENKELIKRPKEYTVQISFPEVAELSRPVMEVNQVFFRYSEKHPVIFDCVDFGIDMDSRICVVGPNGAGKSTLLKLLTGEIEPVKGLVKRNPRLRMGIYNQHFVDRLPMNKTPVEHLRDRYQDQDYQSIRNRLGKYGLEGHAHEVTMRDLSGGQKARVVFVDLSLQAPHILLLDEPTNNLDIETIDALIKGINEFNGGIVCVTHDQRLIDECECELWVVQEQDAKKWPEGFDDYKSEILDKIEKRAAEEEKMRNEKIEAAAKARDEKMAKLKAKLKG
jgi:ATP-binding cassette subfamily F protein 1